MERPSKVIIPKQLWQDDIEDELRKKVGGSYSAKEVDQYIDKLKINMRNMEAVYQERFEEMRTQILSVTRERDNYLADKQTAEQRLTTEIQAIEKKLAAERQAVEKRLADEQLRAQQSTPQPVDINAELEKQGLTAVNKTEYQSLVQSDTEIRRTVGQLENKMKVLADENRRLAKELEDIEPVRKEAAAVVHQAKITKDLLQQREEQLQQKTDELSLLAMRLSEAEGAVRENAAELIQLRDKCATYELESRLIQNEHLQVQNEKERIAKEAGINKERWDAEKEGMIKRYTVLLNGQKQCMQRLSDSVEEAVKYMEGLGESVIKGYGIEE